MQEINIRRVEKNELSTIRNLALNIWPKTYAQILSKEQIEYMLNLFYSMAALEKDFSNVSYRFFILSFDDKDAGYAGVEKKSEDSWHLHKIYLTHKLQGKGLGKALITHVEKVAKEKGAVYLTLDVNRHNKAQDFYKSLGYEILKEKDTDIGNGFFMNDYVMIKTLNKNSQ